MAVNSGWWVRPSLPAQHLPGGTPSVPIGKATGDPNYGKAPLTSQQQLDKAKKEKGLNDQKLKLLRAQESALKKPNTHDKAAVAAYNKRKAQYESQIKVLQTKNTVLGKSIPGLQNKVYEDTGQYDKLLTGSNRDAYLAVKTLFDSYGLGTLADKIYKYVKDGNSPDTISILLQDSKEYKTRFAGNEARKAAGLPVLSAGDYLATESSYRQIMQSAGLPSGFYDQPSDFNSWIGKNVSPSEIQNRVDMATQATVLSNPEYRKALNQMGIDDAHVTAYFLDQSKALPYLQKAAATAQVGAEALRQNMLFDQGYAEDLATMGITADTARQGYQQIAGEMDTMRALGAQYGEDWNQRMSEESTFGTNGDAAAAKKRRLISQERGAFSGGTGAAQRQGGLTQSGGAQ